jgi:hypothetical protein
MANNKSFIVKHGLDVKGGETNLDGKQTIDTSNVSALEIKNGAETVVDVSTVAGSEAVNIRKTLNVYGDIYQHGSAYETHAENLYTKQDTVILRDGAVAGLADGEYAGAVAKNYNGVNDGMLAFDRHGYARVGDVGDLQKIATIEETPTDGNFAYYDSMENQLKTKTISTTDLTDVLDIVKTSGDQTIDGVKTFTASTNVNDINFDLTETGVPLEGQLKWNAEAGTLSVGLPGGGSNEIGQEVEFRARAAENILNGQVVWISGATGAVKEVSLVDSSNFDEACKTIAVATEDISNNQQGRFTTFGLIRDLNTNSFTEGDELYVDISGNLTNVMPSVGEVVIRIGVVTRQSATVGEIFVNIQIDRATTQAMISQENTGFYHPETVTISYDATSRTVTLGGTVLGFYQGKKLSVLTSGWVSDPHPATLDKRYFLTYNGANFVWLDLDTDTVDFTSLLIAYVNYGTVYKWAIRECHGLMDWEGHRSDHFNIGTYRLSGGTIGDFVLNSTTTANRQPSVSATLLVDEDLPTTNPPLSASGNYTQYYLSGTGTPNFITTATDIVPLSGNQPYYNQFTGGAWQQTLVSNNQYMAVWLVAVPTTSDTESQKFRYVWQQGQFASGNIEDIQTRTPNQLDKGLLEGLTPESIYIGRLIIRYTGGNWSITSVENLTGNRLSQATSPAGLYLSTIASTSDFTGLGTIASPLELSGTFTPSVDSTTAFQFFKADGTTQVLGVDSVNGNVGIGGVVSFSDRLYITNTTGNNTIKMRAGTSSSVTAESRLLLEANSAVNGNLRQAFISSAIGTTDGDRSTDLEFRLRKTTGDFGDTFRMKSEGWFLLGSNGLTTNFPMVSGVRSRGTTAIPTAVGGEDFLLALTGNGYTGTSYTTVNPAAILLQSEGVWSNTSTPTAITFGTTAVDSTTRVERMRITSNGNVSIGVLNPVNRLSVLQSISVSPTNSDARKALRFSYEGNIASIGVEDGYAVAPITFRNNGAERMRITSAGNVGIGIEDPVITLEVGGGGIRQTRRDEAGNIRLGRYNGTLTSITPVVTNNPIGAVNFEGYFGSSRLDIRAGAQISAAAEGDWSSTSHPTYLRVSTATVDSISLVERMRITSAGNVGIGMSAPDARLAVSTGGLANETFPFKVFGNNAGNIPTSTGGLVIGGNLSNGQSEVDFINTVSPTYTGTGFRFYQKSADGLSLSLLMNIRQDGNVGIGTASPSELLELSATTNTRLSINCGSDTTNQSLIVFKKDTTSRWLAGLATGAAPNFIIYNAGRTVSDLLVRETDGAILAPRIYNQTVTSARDVQVDANGLLGYVSSTRESKNNIDYNLDSSWIYDLKPASYEYRKQDEEGNYLEETDGIYREGLIAEDVNEVRPEMCYKDEDGALRGVDYKYIISSLLSEIQKQQETIDSLLLRVSALEKM